MCLASRFIRPPFVFSYGTWLMCDVWIRLGLEFFFFLSVGYPDIDSFFFTFHVIPLGLPGGCHSMFSGEILVIEAPRI